MSNSSLPANQRVVELNRAILRQFQIELDATSTILDYGCGSGRHTYEFVDAGFPHTSGFDVEDYVELRKPDDRDRFRFLEDHADFRLPFPDDHFDFVTSTSVFEHVMNPERSIQEIARVLKPGGVTLHAFPARWRPLEPHFFVPFAGAIQARWWFTLWARLGVRNSYQRGLPASEVVDRNLAFSRDGVRYPDSRTIRREWSGCFDVVDFAEREYVRALRSVSRVARVTHSLATIFPPVVNLYRNAHFRVILARQPRVLRPRESSE